MKKSTFLVFIGASLMAQLFAHVSLSSPEGGETFHPGEMIEVSWVEVISHNTLNWDLLFSSDGGLTWESIEADIAVEKLKYQWTVPAITTMQGQIKVVQDNEGADYESSSQNFTIVVATGTNDPQYPIQLAVYPNPLKDYSTIAFENPLQLNYTLTIYNTQGRIVRSIPHITSAMVRVERKNLAAGLYIIQLRDEKHIGATGKLAVE